MVHHLVGHQVVGWLHHTTYRQVAGHQWQKVMQVWPGQEEKVLLKLMVIQETLRRVPRGEQTLEASCALNTS